MLARYVVIIALIIVHGAVAWAQESTVVATSKAATLQQCVEPTDVMRRDHMEFLLHQRDRTVHEGIRTSQHSLVECIDCHAGKDDNDEFVPVNADKQFCQICHQSTAVKMDCFECHATTPDVNISSAIRDSDTSRDFHRFATNDDVAAALGLYLRSFMLN